MLVPTGKNCTPNTTPVSQALSAPSATEVAPAPNPESPSSTLSQTEDPYTAWLAEQKLREKIWASNRAAKRPKVVENADFAVSKTIEPSGCQSDELLLIRKQLDAKNEECATLKNQLRDLQQINADAMKSTQESQEKLCKVSGCRCFA